MALVTPLRSPGSKLEWSIIDMFHIDSGIIRDADSESDVCLFLKGQILQKIEFRKVKNDPGHLKIMFLSSN